MSVALGDWVLYMLEQADVDAIQALRAARVEPVVYSNPVLPEQIYPALVVATQPNGTVNLKVALDGDDWYPRQFAVKAGAKGTDPVPGMWVERNDWSPL